jgi:TonB family protein
VRAAPDAGAAARPPSGSPGNAAVDGRGEGPSGGGLGAGLNTSPAAQGGAAFPMHGATDPSMNIGTSGSTGTFPGDGTGIGTGGMRFPGSNSAAPNFALPAPSVRGLLAPEIVRRVVRRHLPELIFCYESTTRGMRRRPSGEIALGFTIDAQGAVQNPRELQSSRARNLEAATHCMVARMRAWQFPAPESGTVQVRQPVSISAVETPPPRSRRPMGGM